MTDRDSSDDDLPEWITQQAAADFAGVSTTTILHALRRGEITRRQLGRNVPSVNRASLVAWADQWRHNQAFRAARAIEARAAAAARSTAEDPPDDGQVWLSTSAAAAVLGVTSNRVQQLVTAGRLPAIRRGRRWWFRRDHIEQAAAARALRAHQERMRPLTLVVE